MSAGDYFCDLTWHDVERDFVRDAEDERPAREHIGGPGWWPSRDDRDDLSWEDYR